MEKNINLLKLRINKNMKPISFTDLKLLLESEENFENEVADTIIDELTIFPDITFSKEEETDDYIVIVVNANDPVKARNDLCSYKFSHATNLIIEPIRKSKGDGLRLAVYDEDGDPFDKDVYIQIRKGGAFNAGVGNEINFVNILQNVNSDTIVFKDKNGKKLVLKNIESIRDCSKDPGSRMGNRADAEIITNGKPFRISLKKDSAYKVAGLIKRFANESYKIGKLVRQYYLDNGMDYKQTPYITIPITNPELYRWCVFGNDIQKNGAVIQSTISQDDIVEQNGKTIINVDQIVLPTESDATLMKEFPVYMLLAVDKRGTVEVRAAVIGAFGRRYYRNDLSLPDVNESLNESNEIEESKPSDYGTYFFHGTKNKEKLLKLDPPSPEHILFVTADIDYANEYAKRYANRNASNIYVIKLKKNAKIFDPKKYEDSSAFDKYPEKVKDFFNIKMFSDEPRDIFSRFGDIIDYYGSVKKANFDEEEYYFKMSEKWPFGNSAVIDRWMQIAAAVIYFRNRDPSIFESPISRFQKMKKLRELFCKDLKEAGYQAFASEEFVNGKNKRRNVASTKVLGIFDPGALESVEPISIDKQTATKAIRALGSQRDEYDTGINYNKKYDKSNDHIHNAISQNESIDQKLKLGIFYGYHIYADEVNDIFHTKYKIKDYGLKGMAYIGILSITDDEIKFRDLKYNETTDCYEPDEHVCTVHIESKEPCKSRKRKSGFGMEEVQ